MGCVGLNAQVPPVSIRRAATPSVGTSIGHILGSCREFFELSGIYMERSQASTSGLPSPSRVEVTGCNFDGRSVVGPELMPFVVQKLQKLQEGDEHVL